MPDEEQPSYAEATIRFIIVEPDGRIRQSGAVQRQHLESFTAIFPDCRAMEIPANQYRLDIDATSFVLEGVITPKANAIEVTDLTIRADGVDRVSFSVPAGTSVLHAGEIVPIEDGVFEFTTDVLGDYRFPFIAPAAFHHFEVTIHAV
ncbi:hypothetical protein ACQZ6F_08635 [Rhizobium sp. A22-96]